MFSLRMLLAGLAVIVGCERSPSVMPSAAPDTANVSIDAPANDVPQVESARDPQARLLRESRRRERAA